MITAKELSSIIGQRVQDPKVQQILAKIPVPGKRKKNDDNFYHTYRQFGLEFVERQNGGTIGGIFLYPKSRSYTQYGGELPEHLAWTMTQEQIRAALGEPDKENGTEEDQWDRGRYRLGVKFDEKSRIEFVYLSAL